MTPPINHKLLQVYGLKRSGNHAIISWIRDTYGGIIVHLNNIEPTIGDPYQACHQIHVKGIEAKCLRWLPFGYRKNIKCYDHIRSGRRDWLLRRRKIKNMSPKDLMILSFENRSPKHYRLVQPDYASYLGHWQEQLTIFILRDPLNLFASLIRSKRMTRENEEELIRVYKEHACIVRSQEFSASKDHLFINYNRWFLEPEYRIRMAHQIGFETLGEAYSHVPTEGRGSSFDSRSADGEANKMEVLNRWHIYKDDAHFISLFDEELLEICRTMFNMDPDFPGISENRQPARQYATGRN